MSWSRVATFVQVAARAMTCQVQDDEEENQDEGDEAEDFHPPWCLGGRPAVGVAVGIESGRQISHLRYLLCTLVAVGRWILRYIMSMSNPECLAVISRILGWCRSCGTRRSRRTAARCAMRSWTPRRRWWPSLGCAR